MKLLRRGISILLAVCLMFVLVTSAFAYSPSVPSETAVYNAMIAMKKQYPEGMSWTEDDSYNWNGGIYPGGTACAAFAFILSDTAFGTLPARIVKKVSFSDVRVGDILRVLDDTHSVIVLEKHKDHVVIAEGNYGGTIHWGRQMTKKEVGQATFLITRYPSALPSDVRSNHWARDAILFCLDYRIMSGTDSGFQPDRSITRAEFVTMLYNSFGWDTGGTNPFVDVLSTDWYSKAVTWAYQTKVAGGKDLFNFGADDPITRQDIARMLFNIAPSLGYDVYMRSGLTEWGDNDRIADYARGAMSWCKAVGILSGDQNRNCNPAKNATRAEAACILRNFLFAPKV